MSHLQDPTTEDHTWDHRVAPLAFGQWHGSGPMSGWKGTGHHAHRRSIIGA